MSIRRPFKLPGRESWYIDIDRKRRSLGTSDYAEALKFYNEAKQRYEMVRQYPDEMAHARGIKLKAFIARYLGWAEKVRVPATYQAEKGALDKLLEVVGDRSLLSIKPEDADNFIAHHAAKMAKPSVNCHARHLRSILSRAEAWGLVDKNPFRGVKMLRVDVGPPKRLMASDLKKLLDSIDDERLRALVKAYLATGRRRGELINLEWRDVDLERGQYFVRKTKDHLSRWYPISKAFRSVLESLPRDDAYVFPWRSSDTATHLVKAALKKAGYPHLHLHHLRHSFGAAFIEAGGDVRTLMDLLGHRQISTTLIYTKLSPQHLAKEIDRIKFPEGRKDA